MAALTGGADPSRGATDLPPAVDMNVLEALLGELGDEGAAMMPSLWASYLADGEPMVAQLCAAAAGEDRETVRSVAHGLKSSSALLGALPLAALLQQVEDAARTGGSGLAELGASVDAEYQRVAGAVQLLCPVAP